MKGYMCKEKKSKYQAFDMLHVETLYTFTLRLVAFRKGIQTFETYI